MSSSGKPSELMPELQKPGGGSTDAALALQA